MSSKAPGKSYREGITLVELFEMFPTEQAATRWFEETLWGDTRCCGKCGSTKTRKASHTTMPYWCQDCRSYFSVRTGTPMARSKIPLQKWAIAIYLCVTSLKSISSMKLHRDIGVSQPAAWFMLHRIREAWAEETGGLGNQFKGPVEVDETYVGGRRATMSNSKRKALKNTGRGAVGKTAIVGMKDRRSNNVRAKVVERTDAETLQGFVYDHADIFSKLYTDESKAYQGIQYRHETVKHSVCEFVRGQAHTNGIESFWSVLKRAHKGTFHKISPKHLNRYVQEFAAKHNMRESGTLAQMREVVARMVGRNLLYRDLIADNGLSSSARS